MIIANHSLNLSFSNTRSSTIVVEEKAVDEKSAERPTQLPDIQQSFPSERLEQSQSNTQNITQSPSQSLINEDSDVRFIRLLFEAMTGAKMSLLQQSKNVPNAADQTSALAAKMAAIQTTMADQLSFSTGDIETVIERTTRQYAAEIQSFKAVAKLQLEDGSTVEVSLDSTLFEAHYQSTQSQLLINGELVDPLVLTFGSNSGTSNAQLSQQKIAFDLNVDGEIDRISYATGTSAFLALDKNNNGRIDDGSELFGARSGDGFADLAAYDENSDGVIDESDAVFSQLRLSSLGNREDNQDQLQLNTLAEKNVGAIFLANLATPINLQDDKQETTAVVRKSGLFLQEDFTPGIIQHVDIVV